MFDAIVGLFACDKTGPGAAMALLRLNIPGVMLYGGTIAPGKLRRRDLTSATSSRRSARTRPERSTTPSCRQIEDHACPGAGACGGQFTANTMATVFEFMGLSPVGSASPGATDPRKEKEGYRAGKIVMDLLRRAIRPRDLCTRDAFENAIAAAAGTGGSTNSVLHLLAIAREAGVPLDDRRFRCDQRAHADHRRSAAGRHVRRARRRSRRRHPTDRQAHDRGELVDGELARRPAERWREETASAP